MQHADGLRTVRVLLLLAVPLSLVHYTDNYLSFDLYPPGELAGLEVTRDSVWIGWLVFTAGGLLGYWLYVRGQVLAACAALLFYSVSGLISIGHYAEPGMSELAWWRHVAIWIDIALGAAILLFAFWAALRVRRAAGVPAADRRPLAQAAALHEHVAHVVLVDPPGRAVAPPQKRVTERSTYLEAIPTSGWCGTARLRRGDCASEVRGPFFMP